MRVVFIKELWEPVLNARDFSWCALFPFNWDLWLGYLISPIDYNVCIRSVFIVSAEGSLDCNTLKLVVTGLCSDLLYSLGIASLCARILLRHRAVLVGCVRCLLTVCTAFASLGTCAGHAFAGAQKHWPHTCKCAQALAMHERWSCKYTRMQVLAMQKHWSCKYTCIQALAMNERWPCFFKVQEQALAVLALHQQLLENVLAGYMLLHPKIM